MNHSALVMCDDDMLAVELPEKFNYEIWEDPELETSKSMDIPVEPVAFEADEKENLWKPSVILHAFSPFKRNKEERALRALNIASLPEYLHIKGQFFNDLGASLFRRKDKDRSRFKATKINLFGRRYYQKPQKTSSSQIYVGKIDEDVDPAFSIPTPEVAKPAITKSTNIQFSPMEPSQNSAFKSFDKIDFSLSKTDKNHDSNAASIDINFNTPFNTPRSEFIERTINHKSENIENNQKLASSKDYKKNLRPRPTRPPTLFGFSPDASEDEVHGASYSMFD